MEERERERGREKERMEGGQPAGGREEVRRSSTDSLQETREIFSLGLNIMKTRWAEPSEGGAG